VTIGGAHQTLTFASGAIPDDNIAVATLQHDVAHAAAAAASPVRAQAQAQQQLRRDPAGDRQCLPPVELTGRTAGAR
jgi:hypothetical protein